MLSHLEQMATFNNSKNGEPYFFFIPKSTEGEADKTTYIFDTKMNRLLACPTGKDLIKKLEEGDLESEEWIILPQNATVYKVPSLYSRATHPSLGFPQTVKGNLLKPERGEGDLDWVEIEYSGSHYYLPAALLVKKTSRAKGKSGNLELGQERVDRYHALPLEYKPDDLVKVDQKWNYHGDDYPKFLRAEVSQIIEEMLQTANEQGVHIRILSAFRSSQRQRYLYLKAIDRNGLGQKGVAKPGHSEHQLGTTVDLCGLDPKYHLTQQFRQTREGIWLQENAAKYGFRHSYTRENAHITGYEPEPWHFRCMGKRNY